MIFRPLDTSDRTKRYEVAHLESIAPTACPCGQSRRAFVEDPDKIASLHVVEISADSRVHYHKQMTEVYYVLEGTGEMELDGERVPLAPGDSVLIKPNCRHRAIGKLKIVNVAIPAFDPADEWFDE